MNIGWTENVLELDKCWGTVTQTTPVYSREEVLAKRLASSAGNGKVSEVAKLLEANANVNWVGHPSNQTPLLLAVAWGHEDVCKMLLNAGAKTDVHHKTCQMSILEYAQLRAHMIPDSEGNPDHIREKATPSQVATYKRIALLIQENQKENKRLK